MLANEKQPDLESRIQYLEEKNRGLVERVRLLSVNNREQSSLINTLMENVPFGVMIIDANQKIIQINKSAETVLGINRVTAIGHGCGEFFGCHEQYEACPVFDRGEPVLVDEITCNDIKLMRSAVVASYRDEKVLIVTFIDITEIDRAREAIIAASRAKDDFLSKISHELRTPLNAIIGFSDILRSDRQLLNSDEMLEMLEMISDSGMELLDIINTVLDLSRIKSQAVKLLEGEFDINQLVDNLTRKVRPLMEKNSNTFITNCPEGFGSMNGDSPHLSQVLFNILGNAAKFTQNGTVTLDVGSQEDGNQRWIVFSVKDSGIGMEPGEVSRVFNGFEQADNSSSRGYAGLGVGLTIALQLVDMMGGGIDVESRKGEGSLFTVRVPARSPTDA